VRGSTGDGPTPGVTASTSDPSPAPVVTGAGAGGTAAATDQPRPPGSTTTTLAAVRDSGTVPDEDRVVELARADAARRTGHPAAEFRLVRIESVTWRDAALGCPQYERTYDEGDVPGYRIELQWQDVTYHYHGRTGADPFLCQKLDG
jgi:hypothetical protein